MTGQDEKLKKILGLNTFDERSKLIWMWIKSGHITFKEFQSLINELKMKDIE